MFFHENGNSFNLMIFISITQPKIHKHFIFKLFHLKVFLILSSHRADDIRRLGRRNLVASDSSPKVRCHSISTNFAYSVLNLSSSTERLY